MRRGLDIKFGKLFETCVIIAAIVAVCGGCAFFRRELLPNDAKDIRVGLHNDMLLVHGVAMGTLPYAPNGYAHFTTKDGVMRAAVKMEKWRDPNFTFAVPLSPEVAKVVWGDLCLWTRDGGVPFMLRPSEPCQF